MTALARPTLPPDANGVVTLKRALTAVQGSLICVPNVLALTRLTGQSARVKDSDRRRVDLERKVAAIRIEISECVRELLVDDDLPRFAVAERLLELGSAFDSSLESLYRDPEAGADVIAHAGLLAFMNGNREWSAQVLLDEVEQRGSWSGLAATRLAQARFPGVCGVVLGALRATPSSEFDAIVQLLHALHVADCALPSTDRNALLSNPHWQVTTAVAKLFPADQE